MHARECMFTYISICMYACMCGKSEDGDIRAEDAKKAIRIDERCVCMHVNTCSNT
jgi:hypothetical protein